jgi:menaquinone-9 beta-reductase
VPIAAVDRVADVAVVGAGPAGTAAAITLARAGRDVVVVDKARFPRDKFCGDGLTAGALRRLERLGLEPTMIDSWREVHDVWLRGPAGHQVRFPLPRDTGMFAAVARRVELDAALVDLATKSGAEILEGVACVEAVQSADHVALTLSDGSVLTARYGIGADGMWSPLRRQLGLGPPAYRGEWHAFRQYFSDVGPAAASELYCWFEPDILPGYAWSFPVGHRSANVGFGIRRGHGWQVGDMSHLWRELLRRPHIQAVLGDDATPEGTPRAWPIPARVCDMVLASGRAFFVGDAAAATDPMTGEGIGQALATGTWAADAMLGAGPRRPAAARRQYETTVQRSLVPDHRLSELLVGALQHRRGASFAIRMAGATDWTRRNFARWLFEDYPRAVVVTPRRWHRGLFNGPGAFRRGLPDSDDADVATRSDVTVDSSARNAMATNGR